MKSKLKHIISGFAVGVMILSNVFSPIVTAYDAHDASTSFVMPDHNVTLKARSQANNYTIMFRPNGGTGSMDSLPMVYNQSGTLPGNGFTRTGYTFYEWNTSSDGNGSGYASGDSVKNLATSGTVNLYAIWSANKYKVAFNKNQGVDSINPVTGSMSTQRYTYNTTGTLPGNGFNRTGYEFLGWSTGSSFDVAYPDGYTGVYNWTDTSGETVTLYAKWRAKTGVVYTVNHHLMNTGGTDYYYYTGIVYSGTTYDLVTGKTQNYEGFTLSGSAQTGHIQGDGGLVFNYYYNRARPTVTLHAGRGVESVTGAGEYYYNVDVNVSAKLKTGYQNLKWTGDKTTGSFTMPSTNVDMTASATPIMYTITLDVGSGTISGQPTGYNVEQTVTIPDPTRTGYDFVGWSGTNLPTPTSGLTINSGTWYTGLNLVAVWEAKDVTYTVHHYHKVIGQDEYEEKTGLRQTLTGRADTGVTLSDLSLDIDGDCVTYTGGSLIGSTGGLESPITDTTIAADSSTHIYLYYTRNKHTVTLTGDDGIASVSVNNTPITLTVECGATVTIKATPKTGYGFNMWTILSGPTGWDPDNRAPAIPTL